MSLSWMSAVIQETGVRALRKSLRRVQILANCDMDHVVGAQQWMLNKIGERMAEQNHDGKTR